MRAGLLAAGTRVAASVTVPGAVPERSSGTGRPRTRSRRRGARRPRDRPPARRPGPAKAAALAAAAATRRRARIVRATVPQRQRQVGSVACRSDARPSQPPGPPPPWAPTATRCGPADLLFCSGQTPLDPATGELVEGAGGRPDAPLPGEPAVVCAAAGGRAARRGRADGLRHRHGHLRRRSTRPTPTFFADDPPARATIGVAALPLGARRRDRRHRRAARTDGRAAVATVAPVTAADVVRGAGGGRGDGPPRRPSSRSATLTERCGGDVVLKAESLQRTRLVQGPRRAGQARRARRRLRRRRRLRQRGQPRPGAGDGRARARRAVRGVHAGARADRQGGGRPQALGAHRPARRARRSTTAWPPRTSARRRPAWPSCIPSTTRTSSRARARSGSSCSRTCPSLATRHRPGRRRRAGHRRRHRGEVRAPGRRGRRRAGRDRRGVPAVAAGRASRSRSTPGLTIADGIAVKRPGELTLRADPRLGRRPWSSSPRTTSPRRWSCCSRRPSSSSRAPAPSASRPCWQAWSAGSGWSRPVVILSGGNVDAGLLAVVARRHETQAGRRLVLFTRVPDRPGALAALLERRGRGGREHRRRRARARGRRPARARDRRAARARDPGRGARVARRRGGGRGRAPARRWCGERSGSRCSEADLL